MRIIDADKLHIDCMTKDGKLAISQTQLANAPTVAVDKEIERHREELRKITMAYEDKLIELMGKKEFHKFSIKLAKELLAEDICNMPDSEFKNFCLDNFDLITKDDEDDEL